MGGWVGVTQIVVTLLSGASHTSFPLVIGLLFYLSTLLLVYFPTGLLFHWSTWVQFTQLKKKHGSHIPRAWFILLSLCCLFCKVNRSRSSLLSVTFHVQLLMMGKQVWPVSDLLYWSHQYEQCRMLLLRLDLVLMETPPKCRSVVPSGKIGKFRYVCHSSI